MKATRAHLTPDLVVRVERTIERARPRLGRLIDLRGSPGSDHGLIERLEEHDPRHAARLGRDLRRLVDDALWEAAGRDSTRFLKRARRALSLSPDIAPVLSTSGSGYVREEALNRLGTISGPFSLMLLLRRTTDWVPEVGKAAQAALERLVLTVDTPAVDTAIALCAEALLDATERRRHEHRWIETRRRLLDRPGVSRELEKLVRESHEDRAPRLLGSATRAGYLSDQLPSLAKDAAHPRTRARALAVYLDRDPSSPGDGNDAAHANERLRDELLRHALGERSPEVRRVAFFHVVSRSDSELHTDAVFRTSLLDPVSATSEAARAALLGRNVDPTPVLLDALSLPAPSYAAARLLALDPRHRPAIARAYASFDEPRPAWAALLARLGDDEAVRTLRRIALRSPNAARARQASKLLWDIGRRLDETDLKGVVHAGDDLLERGLLRHVRSCSALAIVRLIALRTRRTPDAEAEPLWDAIARKRRIAEFNPSAEETDAVRRELSDLPEIADRAGRLLGMTLGTERGPRTDTSDGDS